MERSRPDIAEIEELPILQRSERESHRGRLMEANRSTRPVGQLSAAREMIGLDVGFHDVADLHFAAFGCLKVRRDVELWIHHSGNAFPPSPEDIRSASGLGPKKLPKDHRHPPLSSEKKGQPS
jgi:hypothetical protein